MKRNTLTDILINTGLILIIVLIAVACKKDDDVDDNNTPVPEQNPLVGTYAFIAASFDEPITVVVNGDTNHYQVNDDASVFVGGGLLGAAPCNNEDNAALQLRADFTSWYVCQGEDNELQQGTWESLADNTVLKLFIAIPADFVVSIGISELSDDKLKGQILTLPMPFDTSIPVGDTLPGGGMNFQLAQVSVEFDRI